MKQSSTLIDHHNRSDGTVSGNQLNKLAMTKASLFNVLKNVCFVPHPETRRGKLNLKNEIFTSRERETNIIVSPGARLDMTGDITIGPWTMIGERTLIYTHDHYHKGRDKPLLLLQEKKGVKWKNKVIGKDVWLHGCTILYQVVNIPNGVVVGAGSVLTKNPGAYEIWAGNPARKIGERQP